jgi:hypothetical protein
MSRHRPATTTAAIASTPHAVRHDTDRHGQHDARITGSTDLLTAQGTRHDLDQPDLTYFGAAAATPNPTQTTSTAVWHNHPDTGPPWPIHSAPVRPGAPT